MWPVRELSASTLVKAPSGFALAFLNTYVRDLCVGGDSTMAMRYTLTHLAGLTLERDVVVRVEYVPGATGAPAELEIAWEPDASLFPRFKGTLHALPAGKETCTLTLGGTYNVPGGVAGQLFDAVIGVRIAHGTLENLLARFRDAIEDDYKKRMVFA
jgi:hypothetical protein